MPYENEIRCGTTVISEGDRQNKGHASRPSSGGQLQNGNMRSDRLQDPSLLRAAVASYSRVVVRSVEASGEACSSGRLLTPLLRAAVAPWLTV